MIELHKGKKVHYDPEFGEPENGKVKSIQNEKYAFVVYNCAGNWDDYEDYTGARTRIADLREGWTDDAKTKFSQDE